MRSGEGHRYLNQFPHLWSWMNRCRACQHLGYKPELPETLDPGIVAPRYLRRYFDPLPLDEHGLCEYCARSVSAHGGAADA